MSNPQMVMYEEEFNQIQAIVETNGVPLYV